jgi:multiple sugar transport system substrate-binding protein
MAMPKFVAILVSLILLSTLSAACVDNNNEKQPVDVGVPDSDADQEKVTISIYYPLPDQVENRVLEDGKIIRFQEKYPHVEIIKSDWHYNVNEIGVKMAASEVPTFYNTFATEAKYLVERGWAADITELWNNYEHKNSINPALQSQFIIGGKVYGVVQKGYSTSIVVNKKLLDDKGVAVPPYDWTWEDMLNTAVAVTDPGKGISGIAPMGKGNEAGWNWTNFLFEAGGEILSVEGDKVKAVFNSGAGLKALELYDRLRWEAQAIPQDWALGWGEAVGSFAQGRTAMVIAGADGPVAEALNQGGMKPEDVLAFPMPAQEKGGKHYGILGGDYMVINPNATKAEQEAAFNYIVFDHFTDVALKSLEKNIQDRKKDGKYYIPAQMNYYMDESSYGQKVKAILDKYDNVYRYSVESNNLLDGKPEAQYHTQDYYEVMTYVIQEIFSNQNVDLKARLDEAAKIVQEEYFDEITVE